MRKRKEPTPVFHEWLRLTETRGPEGYPPATEVEWSRLWESHVAGEGLERTDVDDAALICVLGWDLAVQRGDFPAALSRLRRWFEHPEWRAADPITRTVFRSQLALGHLLTGDEPAALDLYREMLSEPPEPSRSQARTALVVIRSQLQDFTERQPPGAPASPAFAGLVAALIRRFRGCVMLARSIVPDSVTYGELADVLERCRRHTSRQQPSFRADQGESP